MIRRKLLHLAVIVSMLTGMVGFVLPTPASAAGLLINLPSVTFAPQQINTQGDLTMGQGGQYVTIANTYDTRSRSMTCSSIQQQAISRLLR